MENPANAISSQRRSVASTPIAQFKRWFEEAISAKITEPNAMTLCTISPSGSPSSRVVLLKDYMDRGLTFFSNYQSRKGRDIEVNPQVALCFYWPDLERQVRIEGVATRLSAIESDEYFAKRPRGSQLGSSVSPQSSVVSSRDELEAKLQALTQQYEGTAVPRPAHWGGYCVTPNRVEFWQGRENRLHDRILYEQSDGEWRISRLAP